MRGGTTIACGQSRFACRPPIAVSHAERLRLVAGRQHDAAADDRPACRAAAGRRAARPRRRTSRGPRGGCSPRPTRTHVRIRTGRRGQSCQARVHPVHGGRVVVGRPGRVRVQELVVGRRVHRARARLVGQARAQPHVHRLAARPQPGDRRAHRLVHAVGRAHRRSGPVTQRALQGARAAGVVVGLVPDLEERHVEVAPLDQLVRLVVEVGQRRMQAHLDDVEGGLRADAVVGRELLVDGLLPFVVEDSGVGDHPGRLEVLLVQAEGDAPRAEAAGAGAVEEELGRRDLAERELDRRLGGEEPVHRARLAVGRRVRVVRVGLVAARVDVVVAHRHGHDSEPGRI